MASPDLADLRKRMDSALEVLRKEFAGLRTGPRQRQPAGADLGPGLRQRDAADPGRHRRRARAAHADVQVWDRGLVKAVEKAIRNSSISASTRRSTAS